MGTWTQSWLLPSWELSVLIYTMKGQESMATKVLQTKPLKLGVQEMLTPHEEEGTTSQILNKGLTFVPGLEECRFLK